MEALRRVEDDWLRPGKKLILLILSVLSSCISNPFEEFGPVPLLTQGVYVLNEGNPGRGNSSLTLYLPDSMKAYLDIFSDVNGRILGDGGGDMVVAGSQAFILMRGSGTIEVIRTADNKSLQRIPLRSGRSPYSMAVVGSKGYVTNMSSPFVTVIDINSLSILRDSINVGSNPQGIAAIGGKVYVCSVGFVGRGSVAVLDASSDRVLRTIQVGFVPMVVQITPDGRVWVLCAGSAGNPADPNDDLPAAIYVIDPSFDLVIDTISVDGHPGRMVISADGFAYLVGENRIMKFNTRIDQLVTAGFIVGSLTSTLYSVAVDDYSGDIYVGDAKDKVQNGEVRIYRSDGVQKGLFGTGILPGTIAFKR